MDFRSLPAIVIAALIIGASIVGASFVDRYEISAAQGSSEHPVAWRVDKRTGETALCLLAPPDNPFDKIAAGKNVFVVTCKSSLQATEP